jgi:hypothetical protein
VEGALGRSIGEPRLPIKPLDADRAGELKAILDRCATRAA